MHFSNADLALKHTERCLIPVDLAMLRSPGVHSSVFSHAATVFEARVFDVVLHRTSFIILHVVQIFFLLHNDSLVAMAVASYV